MKRRRPKPSYSLDKVKELAKSGAARVNSRSISFIVNHIDTRDPRRIVTQVILSIESEDFIESFELDNIPGTWADVYKPTYDGEKWYVKLFIDDDGSAVLHILSANWDGSIH